MPSISFWENPSKAVIPTDAFWKKQMISLTALCFCIGVCLGQLLPLVLPAEEPAVQAAFSSTAETVQPEQEPEGENLFAAPRQTDAETPGPSSASAGKADGFVLEVLSGAAETQTKGRILIYHTHTYEAYEQQTDAPYEETTKWRTADERFNMVRVGDELAALLTGLGYEVEHDRTAFEPPVLDSAYTRSLTMLQQRLAAGERYDLMIDLHRDAYPGGSQGGANAVTVGSAKLARLMLLVGKGEGQTGRGFDEKPDWEANLRIAQAVTDAVNAQTEGLCRKVMLKAGRFNQHVQVGCLLVEVGNNRNTLGEALASMPYLADALDEAWSSLKGN